MVDNKVAVMTFCMVMLFEQSLPVAFGEETAKWICVGATDITQLSVDGTSFLSISNIYISLENLFFFFFGRYIALNKYCLLLMLCHNVLNNGLMLQVIC